MTALSRQEILRLIGQNPPLVEGYKNLEDQVQPNGFDLTLKEIAVQQSSGTIGIQNSQRVLSAVSPLVFSISGFLDLPAGIYMVTFNEIVHLPEDVMALGAPRSSLLRCGVTINNAVWDAGYQGRSQALMVVYNSLGFRVQKDARIEQLVFFKLADKTEGYKGAYQGENINPPP